MTHPHETRDPMTYPAGERDVDNVDRIEPRDETEADALDARRDADQDTDGLDASDVASPNGSEFPDRTDAAAGVDTVDADARTADPRDETEGDTSDAGTYTSDAAADTSDTGTYTSDTAGTSDGRDEADVDTSGERADTDLHADTDAPTDTEVRADTDVDVSDVREGTAADVDRDTGPTDQGTDDGQPVDAAWPMNTEHPTNVARPEDEAGSPADGAYPTTNDPAADVAVGQAAVPDTSLQRSDDEAGPWDGDQDGRTDVAEQPGAYATPMPTVEPAAGEAMAETEPPEGDVAAATAGAESMELMPGDVPAEPVAGLWGAGAADGIRDRWRALQLRFVDDPHGAADEAASLVGEAIESLTSSLSAHQSELDGWRSSADAADTERLRVAVRRYREYLDRLLEL